MELRGGLIFRLPTLDPGDNRLIGVGERLQVMG